MVWHRHEHCARLRPHRISRNLAATRPGVLPRRATLKRIMKHLNQIALALAATFTLAAITPLAHAEGGVPLWTNRYRAPGNDDAFPHGVAVDSSGNAFVSGDAGTIA